MTQEKGKHIIVVLGMHRSGTSAVTRGLQTLGVDLGNYLNLPVPGVNEKGFYEDIEIQKLNIELLNALDSDWHALSFIPPAAFAQDNLEAFKLRAIELMHNRMGSSSFGMKDPRIARLLPFWSEIFKRMNINSSYVVAVRHPMSVDHSLNKRDGFDNEKSHYLWLEHVIPTILETIGAKRVVVDFDLLMADPQGQLKRVAKALNLPFNSDSSDLKEYIAEFLDIKLRHSKFEIEDLRTDPTVPLDVISAHEMLSQLARDEIDIDAPEVEEKFEQLNAGLLALSHAFNYVTRLERKMVELDGQINIFEQTIADLTTHIHNVEADWVARGLQINNLEQTIADQTTHIHNVEADWVARGLQINNLEQTIADQTTHFHNVEADWVARGLHIANLEQVVANLEQVVANQATHIHNVEAELTKFHASWYGRARAAARKFYHLISSN